MNNKFIHVIAILSIIITIFATPAFTKVFAKVSGTVKNEKGEPIEGAKVVLIFSTDGSKEELTTNKKGIWRKVDARPGAWVIGFMAEGYKPDNIKIVLSSIKKNPPIDIRLSPVPEAPINKGDALYRQKKYAEALQEYQRVLAENKDRHQLHEKIGLCYYKLNDLDNAIKAFELILEKEPESRDTLINLSAIYLEKGNLEEGMKHFKQLDEESIKDHSTFYNIAIILFNKNQMDLAIEYFKKCISRNPDYIDGYYQLALAYLNKGNMEEAKKNFQKIIELAPDSEKATEAKKMVGLLQ